MPKEQINTPKRRTVTQFEDGGYGCGWTPDDEPLSMNQHWEETPVVYVGWSHEIEPVIQITVEVDPDEVLRAADEINRARARKVNGSDVFFATTKLSRAEAQKLIKVTRRARDQVFGGDE